MCQKGKFRWSFLQHMNPLTGMNDEFRSHQRSASSCGRVDSVAPARPIAAYHHGRQPVPIRRRW